MWGSLTRTSKAHELFKKITSPPPQKKTTTTRTKKVYRSINLEIVSSLSVILKEHSKAISSLKSYTTATRFNYASGDSGSVIVSR